MSAQSSDSEVRFGLRAKFIAAVAVELIAVATVILLVEQFNVRRTIRMQTVAQGASIANTIESTASYYVLFGLTGDLALIAKDLDRNDAVDYADFLGADGKVLASTTDHRMPPSMRKVALSAKSSDLDLTDEHGSVLHVYLRPFFESREAADHGAKPSGYFRLVINEAHANATMNRILAVNLLVIVIALAVAIALALAASRIAIRPILMLVEAASRIADGDLTRRAEITSHDELGRLGRAFNAMAGKLENTISKLVQSQGKLSSVADTVGSHSRTVISRIDSQGGVIDQTYFSIDQLNSGVRKITDNVEALSASSEETSSSMLEMVASMEEVARHTDSLFESVEDTASATHEMVSSINEVDQNVDFLQTFVTETSSSMVQMSASINQVETNAARSYDLAAAVAAAAESGMGAVRSTIDGMEQIRSAVVESNGVVLRLGDRSAEIGKILNVIDDVAEQTNLLALNAAILAAQAGEYGKGFSVVAGEIRELSERTAMSTKEIGGLIRSVQEEVANALKTMARGSNKVEEGVSLSHDAGKALQKILESAEKSSGMVREIATATREQALGSETVLKSIERLQEMVRQINSATRQQAAGSNHILKAVETMREITKYVRQATLEQKSGSVMISKAAERMIEMIHEIFEAAAAQASESGKIVQTMEKVRETADSNRRSANEMNESISLLSEAIRGLDEEIRRFRIRS